VSARRRPAYDPLYRITRKPRACDKCGDPYNRRDLIEVWTARNPGHRTGWMKARQRLCMKCSSVVQAQRILVVAQVTPIKSTAKILSLRKRREKEAS
jgi:hypothetical protein